MRITRVAAACLLAAAVTAAGTASPAAAAVDLTAASRARTLAVWPHGADGAFAESLTSDGAGGYLASVTVWGPENTGSLWRIDPRGGRTAFGRAIALGPCAMLLGVTAVHGAALVTVYHFQDCVGTSPASGVLSVTTRGVSRVMTLPADTWPNGIVVHAGSVYVTDSLRGAIWRGPLAAPSSPVTPAFTSPLLAGTADNPIGANGITYRNGRLYVTSSAQGLVLRLTLTRSGAVRSPSVVARDPRLVTADGVTVDRNGRLWVAVNTGAVLTVSPSGRIATVRLPASRLDYPTQVVLDRDRVVVENGSYDKGTPSVVAFSG